MKTIEKNGKRIWVYQEQKVPARVMEMLRDKEIRLTDFLLMCVINDQVKHYGDKTGVGCFQKNETLAFNVGVSPTYVSECLSFLEKKGIVLIVRIGRHRYLELEWSRTAEERSLLKGEYGEALRKVHADLVERLGNGENEPSGKVEGSTSLREKSKESLREKSKDIHKERKIEQNITRTPNGVATNNGFDLDSRENSSQTERIAATIRRVAARIKHVCIPKSHHLLKAIDKAASQMQGLDRVQSIIDRYDKHAEKIDSPHIFCIASVKMSTLTWLESELDKLERPRKLPNNRISDDQVC